MKCKWASAPAPPRQTSCRRSETTDRFPTECLRSRVAARGNSGARSRYPWPEGWSLPESPQAQHFGERDVEIDHAQAAHCAAEICIVPIAMTQQGREEIVVPGIAHPRKNQEKAADFEAKNNE